MPPPEDPDKTKNTIFNLFRTANLGVTVASVALLSLLVCFVVWALGVVVPAALDQDSFGHTFLFPVPFPPWLLGWRVELTPLGGAAWFVFLCVAVTLSFIWLIYRDGSKMTRHLGRFSDTKDLPKFRSRNGLIVMPQIFMADIFFSVAFAILAGLMGWIPETDILSDVHLWQKLYLLANASVWEELVCRVLYIGVPLLLIHAALGRMEAPWHRYILGGGFDPAAGPAVVLILVSSFAFGMAHVPSWGLWKAIPTFVGGVAFGYLFLRKGLYAAILLHFFIDYLSIPLDVWGAAANIPIGLSLIIFVVCGLVFFIYFFYAIIRTFLERLGIVPAEEGDKPRSDGPDRDLPQY